MVVAEPVLVLHHLTHITVLYFMTNTAHGLLYDIFIFAVSIHAMVGPAESFGVVILPSAICLLPQHMVRNTDSLLCLMFVKVYR